MRAVAILALAAVVACSGASSSNGPAPAASGGGEGASDAGMSTTTPPSDAGGGPSAPADGGGPAPVGEGGGGAPGDAGYGTSVTLGFASSAFTMYASISGGPPHLVQLDTGSLGAYVPKAVLGASATVSTTTCSITYVSSGNTLNGYEATVQVALLGSTSSGDVSPAPTTVPMTVCAVDDATWNGGMMGVGFGRGNGADPTRNVLLQMAGVKSGAMRAGYVLRASPSTSVTIGLSAADVAGFQTVPLTPDPSGNGDWVARSLRGCLALPDVAGFTPECGGLLVDTGIGECILWGPQDPTLGGAVPAGQTTVPSGVAIAITTEAGASILDDSFVVGTGPNSPTSVTLRTASAFSINTGRALLAAYDYLFDAQAGLVGFRVAK